MKQIKIIGLLVGIFVGFSTITALAKDTIKFETDPQQRIDVPFRLFKTENMWTFLLLDTRYGKVWQIQYTVNNDLVRIKIPINDKSLVQDKQVNLGRFTLYPTNNMWTFLLLDQEDGRIWQCQFSLGKKEERFILPIEDLAKIIQ